MSAGMKGLHPTNDPTNPLHRLAEDVQEGRYKDHAVSADVDFALDRIATLEAERDAYRSVAINLGWNWSLCNAYGKAEYEKQHGNLIDQAAKHIIDRAALAAGEGLAPELPE